MAKPIINCNPDLKIKKSHTVQWREKVASKMSSWIRYECRRSIIIHMYVPRLEDALGHFEKSICLEIGQISS